MSLVTRLLQRFCGERAATPPPRPPEHQPTAEQPPMEPVVFPEAQVAAPQPALMPELSPAPALKSGHDQDEAQDGELEEAAGPGEEDGDDPFIGSGEPLKISLPTADSVAEARRRTEQLALTGPQRVTLVDPAGPGSLAETLGRLEAEGRVTSEVLDNPETGPYILYRPVS